MDRGAWRATVQGAHTRVRHDLATKLPLKPQVVWLDPAVILLVVFWKIQTFCLSVCISEAISGGSPDGL